MIFRPWQRAQFEGAGFVQVAAVPLWERRGFPLYSSSRDPSGAVWIPAWASVLFHAVCDTQYVRTEPQFSDNLARMSAAAIRSEDPDAFVDAVLAAYALGGWEAALQLAGVQDGVHE